MKTYDFQKSEALFERAKKVAPGGVHSPVRSFKGVGQAPIFFAKAAGPYLWDVSDQRYIDYCQSFGPLILGHRDPEVQEAVLGMLHKAWTFGATEPYSLELAEWLQQEIPWLEKIRFVSSGTEAVMSALRVARAATGKDKVLKFDGCYHGHVDSLLVQSGSGLAGEGSATSAGIPEHVAKTTIVCPLDNEEEFANLMIQHGGELSAVIIEPLPANYGLLPQRVEFLKFVAKECRERKVLLIFDEVISGFRVALGGMSEIVGIQPDLVTYGKILGGGFPVGCYAGRKDLMDLVAPLGPVYQAGTLSANPVGMVAGLTTLKKMKREKVWDHLAKATQNFTDEVQAVLQGRGWQIAHEGSLFWIFRANDPGPIRSLQKIDSQQSKKFNEFFKYLLARGVYLAPNAFEVGFLSYAHTDAVLAETVSIMKEAIATGLFD